jgi:peptide/nickel transport system substrate-binding protein
MASATEFNENPVGTGALKFVELQPQDFVRFEMNKEYWRGKPHLEGFIWKVMPDDDAQVTALSNGEMDVMKNVNTADVAARVNEIPGVTTYRVLGHFTYAFFFNHDRFEPLKDGQVREAIAMALDKPTIITAVIGGDTPHAEQLLNPNHVGYNPDVRVIGYDPEGAVALLNEAGWTDSDGDGILDKDGQPLAFTVISERADLPDAIQGYLREVGIDMSINIVERAVREELQRTGEWDAYIGWDGFEIPFNAFVNNWTTGAWTNYSNADVDSLIQEADSTGDADESEAKIMEVEEILTDDVAAIWLHYYISKIAVSDNIAGLQLPPTPADQNNTGVFYHLEDLYMKEPK